MKREFKNLRSLCTRYEFARRRFLIDTPFDLNKCVSLIEKGWGKQYEIISAFGIPGIDCLRRHCLHHSSRLVIFPPNSYC